MTLIEGLYICTCYKQTNCY